MAKHKAPTEVTVVAHQEQSAFAAFVERHWMKGAVIAIVITCAILYTQYQNTQEQAAVDESWNQLMTAIEGTDLEGDADRLQALAEELSGTQAGPWALYLRAQSLREAEDFEGAVASLLELKSQYPDHPLVKDTYAYGESTTPLSAVEYLSKAFESERAWRAETPRLFANPEPPATAPRVKLTTDLGDVVIALYSDQAPLHAENFLKQVEAGFYDGLIFHRTQSGERIDTGDPTTKDPDSQPQTWGRQGSETGLESEDSGLSHFEGVLASLPQPGGEGASDGGLITITARNSLMLDGRNVVFGKVIEGLDVVKDIASQPTDQTTLAPQDPTKIISATGVAGT